MSWKKFKGYYVYTYLDENSNPYYVGMGCNNRVIAKHLYVQVPSFDNIIVEDDLTQQQAWDREIELIAMKGRPWSDARRLAQQNKTTKEF
jgi:hypothetical protein